MTEETTSVIKGGQTAAARQEISNTVVYEFTPLVTFESEEFQSCYCEGMTYFVREGNDILHAAVEKWKEEGKVK